MNTDFSDGYVRCETLNNITTIEFFHQQSNSLPAKILKELTQEINNTSFNEDCKLIIIKSAGDKAFCAGASFDELAAITNEEDGTKFFSGFANVINAMRKCPKLIIGRIHGKCVGGGVGLAAACDYAVASENAAIKLSELALGIGPFVVGPAVERKIGLSAFSQLSINASTWQSAVWAKEKGLYNELHTDIKSADESIKKLSAEIVNYSATAMAELKKILWQSTENWDDLLYERAAISGRLVLSDFTKNYIQQFKEKNKPKS